MTRTALVLPGRMLGPGTPTVMFAGNAAERRGATVHRHEWTGRVPLPGEPGRAAWVAAQVAEALTDDVSLVIAKSLGTLAAPLVADLAIPAVWLTPLLTEPDVVSAIERSTAPSLLVGGTADEAWDGTVARRLSPYVLEVPGADHGLYVPGPLADSVMVLAGLVREVEHFLDRLGWSEAQKGTVGT